MNLFVFDIETIPDVAGGQRLYDLHGLDAAETVKAMQHIRRQQTGGDDFLRPYLQKIVAISMVMRHGTLCKVWSLGNPEDDERELIRQFFGGVAKYTPTLVSWNGSNFDLPVLHYRALVHAVPAPRYWDIGEHDRDFRFNNYLSRYHWRHIDLMDVLAGFSPRATAPLDDIATLLGLPGKQGMDGSKVWDAYQAGELLAIRHYCETDVLNTYLVYLRFQLMRGHLDDSSYQQECQLLRQTLQAAQQPHFDAFLQAWTE